MKKELQSNGKSEFGRVNNIQAYRHYVHLSCCVMKVNKQKKKRKRKPKKKNIDINTAIKNN